MIIYIIFYIFIIYITLGFLFWIVPCVSDVGCVDMLHSYYNFWFIFFWLPAVCSEKIQEVISR